MSTLPRTAPVDAAATRPAASVALLAVSALLVMLPVTIVVPGIKETIADRYGASPFWAHSFMWVNLLGALLAFPLIARLANHSGSRGATAAAALTLDAAFFALMAAAPSLPLLLAVRALEGVAHMAALAALMAAAADAAPPESRGRTMGLVGAAMMLGTAAGTRLGGVLWVAWPGASFEAAALLAAGGAIFIAATLPGQSPAARGERARPNLGLLLRHRELIAPYAFAFVERLCIGVVVSSFVLFLGAVHGLSPDAISRLLFLFLFPFAILTYPAGRLVDHFGAVAPILAAGVLFGALVASYGYLPASGLPAAMIASGVLSALLFAPTLTLCADLAPPGQRGAVYAGFNVFGSLGMVIGPFLGGTICQLLSASASKPAGYQVSLLAVGVIQTLVALACVAPLIRLRRSGRIR